MLKKCLSFALVLAVLVAAIPCFSLTSAADQIDGYVPAAPLAHNGYLYGDISGDGNVGSDDALYALQYVVGKVTLKNKQLAMGDVNDDVAVNAEDALNILKKIVGKLSEFAIETKENLPSQVEVGINQSHIVHTQYPTATRVVAETDVMYWGAKGDGVTDDTKAFQDALNYVGKKSGGTVFVPAGTFAIRGNLTIPNGVTLQGDAPKVTADGPVQGTLLLAYAGRGNENATPFIVMENATAIANCSVYYPEQTMDAITPYPWTIRQGGHYGMALTNVRLVNSYLAIGMSGNHNGSQNALQNIRGVVGTALKMGLILNGNVDICRVENVTFTPDCWVSSGLADTAAAQTMKDYIYANATAFRFEQVDWTYITDVTAKGYHVAMVNSQPPSNNGGLPNGHVYHVNFTDCYIGYHAIEVDPIGMMITDGTITARYPVLADQKFGTCDAGASFTLNRLTLTTTGDVCVKSEGIGVVTLEHCTLNANGGTGVVMTGGKLSATKVEVKNAKLAMDLANGVAAQATNCMTKSTFTYKGTVKTLWDSSLKTADYSEAAKYDYNQETVTFTAGDNFADVTRAPYNADTTNTTDIAPTVQKALNDVAAAGGGVVYIPSGRYRFDTAVTVPAGVELKGSATFPQHSHAYSTTLYTDYGRGGDEDTTAMITLEPTAGINGFKVYYDKQVPVNEFDAEPYAFTVRGTGMNNFVMNVNFINSFYQTDLASYKCDGHYVNGATGYPLQQGIVVGGGSSHGIVRDCQFNIHYFYDNPVYGTTPMDTDAALGYGTYNSEAYVVRNVNHQTMFHNFVFGAHSGLAVEDGADVFVLGFGSDFSDRGISVRGTPKGKITFVNTQLVVLGNSGINRNYVNIEETFTGAVHMTQTNMWGDPSACSVLVGGGKLYFSQGTNVRSGNYGFQAWNGSSLFLDTVYHMRGDVFYDVYLSHLMNTDILTKEAVTYGNIYTSGGLLYDPYERYTGPEFK